MEITNVLVRPVEGNQKLKAYVSVTFDECFAVHNIRIIEGADGLFVGMPSRKLGSGVFKDVAHPVCAEFREKLVNKILEEYKSKYSSEKANI